MLKIRPILLTGTLLILAGLIGWLAGSGVLSGPSADGLAAGVPSGLQAQAVSPENDDLHTLLKRLDSENQPWTLHFAVPLDTGDRSHTMTASGAVIGRDYFCYGEPWNSSTRYHCTPFSNIVSVTFED